MSLVRGIRTWWGESLRNRLLLSSGLTVVVFLVLLGILSLAVGQASVQHEVERGNRRLAVLVAKDLDAQYYSMISNLRLLRRQLETSADTLSGKARAMLDIRLSSPLTYRALYLLDDEGHPLVHLGDSLEALEAFRDIEEIATRPPISLNDEILTAYEAAKSSDLSLSPAHIVGADQVPVVYVSMPVEAEQGPDQVLVAEVDLRNIWRRIDEVYTGTTGRSFVVSQDGTIIAHPTRAYIGQPLPSELSPLLDGYEGQTGYTDPTVVITCWLPTVRWGSYPAGASWSSRNNLKRSPL